MELMLQTRVRICLQNSGIRLATLLKMLLFPYVPTELGNGSLSLAPSISALTALAVQENAQQLVGQGLSTAVNEHLLNDWQEWSATRVSISHSHSVPKANYSVVK